MTTWAELRAHLLERYAGARAAGDDAVALAVELGVERPEANPFWRSAEAEAAGAGLGAQPIRARRVDVLGAAWVQIESVIGALRYVSQLEMLASNVRTPIGALCLLDGALGMCQKLPIEGLRVADLDETIRAVAHQSARARRNLTDGLAPRSPG